MFKKIFYHIEQRVKYCFNHCTRRVVIKTKRALNINVYLVGILKKCLNCLYLFTYTGRWKVILDCSNFRTDFFWGGGVVNPNRKFIIIFRRSHIRGTSTSLHTSSFTDFLQTGRVSLRSSYLFRLFTPRRETLHSLQMQA